MAALTDEQKAYIDANYKTMLVRDMKKALGLKPDDGKIYIYLKQQGLPWIAAGHSQQDNHPFKQANRNLRVLCDAIKKQKKEAKAS